jgi:hypothetical protein
MTAFHDISPKQAARLLSLVVRRRGRGGRKVPTFDEVAAFVREQIGHCEPLTAATALQIDLSVFGDDLWELIDAYAARFGVDVSGFLWYFHSAEKGSFNMGALLFLPPNAQVRQIPITIGMLHEFAQRGRWEVEYPLHNPPQSRPDIRVNQLLALAFLAGVVITVVLSCIG